ncbi:MAG TPA: N-6 DNA methylase [Terriglobia bacterium]|jgi:type I restriction-modification system DNA methylase subunit|nr:N-6 DNA methylase [Terriglobia bacterium]
MPEILEPRGKDILRAYVRDVKAANNESAKRARFAAVIAELFPGTNAVSQYTQGVEKLIRIEQPTGTKKGHADAYYGNAIIEFERNLSATLTEAQEQLREYVAGVWQQEKEPRRPLLAIASDGINWRIYRPVLPAGAEPTKDTVTLDELRDFKVAEDTLGAFWLWLTSLLFRPQQIEPTADRFQLDFGAWSPLYRQGMAALKIAWAKVSGEPEAQLAFETWQNYLTVTYGRLTESATVQKDLETAQEISELEDLFLRHTYLSSIARLLIWAALSQGKGDGTFRQVAKDVLSGRYFESKRLANLVDDDFFHWLRHPAAEEILASTWERILSHLTEYDLSRIRQDVLKGVYQQLIDPKDRHDLGEYYTPDWLCERMVTELLPKQGFKAVLDPSCGSGSFLRANITHFLEHNPEGTDNERLKAILAHVSGIDIHPVAVTISRATYVLALGKLVNSARKPINIPVYLADSLFLPHEVEASLIEKLSGVEITYGSKKDQRQFVMPDMLIQSPELFDDAIAACTVVAEDYAKTKKESRTTMANHLTRAVPDLFKLLGYEQILDALWEFTEGLAGLIRDKKNSIWSFIIRNSYRPAMLKGRFDFVIGNPPWLSYRYISDPEYQSEIKRRALDRYRIAPKSQKLFTQMELATVFLAHSMATFANPTARLGFVMPRGVLSSDQHQNLIRRKYSSVARFRLTGYWDLWDVLPLFNVPACVLFAKWDISTGSPKDKLPVLEWNGNLPGRDIAWDAAKAHLNWESKEGSVIYLGTRAALSTALGSSVETKPSKYQKIFKQGATIVPRSFYFVRIADLPLEVDPGSTYWAETDPEQAALAKAPYGDVELSGSVEGKFIYSTVIGRHILPFAMGTPATVILPVEQKNGSLRVLKAAKLTADGYREIGKWMEDAEKIWKEKRKDKAKNQNLYEWLDYQGKLTAQNFDQGYLVLYNAEGTNVAATFFDRGSIKSSLVVEHTVYWGAFADKDEAHYMSAVLNSETVNLAIKPFQATGLLGERHIQKKLLELPIPTYDHEDAKHTDIAHLGLEAWGKAQAALKSGEFPKATSLARQRAFIRTHLKAELMKIDKLVANLLK